MYLDYVNNFLTYEGFAEHYGLTIEGATELIDVQRQANKILDFLRKQYKAKEFDVTRMTIDDIEFLTSKMEAEGIINHTVQQVGLLDGEYYNEVRYFSDKLKKTIVFYEDLHVQDEYDNPEKGLEDMSQSMAILNQEISKFEEKI